MEIKNLTSSGFHFKKQLGQNFIFDKNLLGAIATDAGVTNQDNVLEIGTGAGTLTEVLAQKAKLVASFEVDLDLKNSLEKLEKDHDNLQIYFEDVLRLSDDEIRDKVPEPFKVVANLPYYVTTPMIMRFVESDLNVESMTLMMQKEVADRLVAKEGTKEYGAITVALNAVASVCITRTIGRRMFYPMPGVDSALVYIKFERNKYNFSDFNFFRKTVKSAFAMRRKTLKNNLISGFGLSGDNVNSILTNLNIPLNARGETLSCEKFVELSNYIQKFLN